MAPTRTASLRLQLIDSVSGPSKNVANSLGGVDRALARLGRSSSPEVRRLGKQLEYLQKKSGAIEDFTSSRRGLKDMSTELKLAQSNVSRLQKALAATAKPNAKLEQDLESARSKLRLATAAFREQGAAVRTAERALHSFGVSSRSAISRSQKDIRDQLAQTIREMRRFDQEARKPKPRPGGGGSGGSGVADAAVTAGGIYAANAGRTVAQRSFFTAVDFNQAAEYQAALGDFKGADRAALNRQAEKIGGETRFSNVDVVRAQTAILQGGIRDSKTIMDLTTKVTEYALAMGVTLEEGAETVRGSALSKRVNLSDASAIGKFVDNLVWMAKNGGLGDEDVRQFMKYGGAPTTGAALPDEYASAIAMILRRSGVRGDEAGVFARSMSSKLVAPTKKGRDALAAMGIDYNKFVTMPDVLNEKGIGIMLKNNFGVRMTKDVQKAVNDLLENGEFVDPETGESRAVGSDSGEFVARMSDILAPLFAKDGKMTVQDAKALAKGLSDYHKYSVKSVDAVGLFEAIMSSNPTLGNLNAFFTDKQGGRANMIAQQFPLFRQMLNLMQNVPGGIANKIGTEANQGLYGDWTKLTGTVETALLRIGQDWEFASRPLINKTNEVIDGFTQLSENTRRLIEAFGAAIALFAGFSALRAGASLLGRMRGGGGAGGVAAGVAAAKASRFAPLLALTRFAMPLVAAGTLQGDTANNAYVNASSAERQKMRDQARATAAALNARQAEAERQATAAQARRSAAAAPLQNDLAATTVSWPFAAQQGMREYVAALTQGGDQAEREAQSIGQGIEDQLNIVANPDVNTGRLERALAIARQLAAALRSESSGVAISGSSPSSAPAFGGPRRRGGPVKAGVTYPIGGKGVELFTPGADGYVTPNGGGAGARATPQFVNHFHFHGGKASKADAEEVFRTLDRLLNRSEQVVFGGTASYGDT